MRWDDHSHLTCLLLTWHMKHAGTLARCSTNCKACTNAQSLCVMRLCAWPPAWAGKQGLFSWAQASGGVGNVRLSPGITSDPRQAKRTSKWLRDADCSADQPVVCLFSMPTSCQHHIWAICVTWATAGLRCMATSYRRRGGGQHFSCLLQARPLIGYQLCSVAACPSTGSITLCSDGSTLQPYLRPVRF